MKKHNYFRILTILFLLATCSVHAAESAKEPDNDKNIILPDETLFDPLMADPRWPHFSVAYQSYIDDDELKNVGATSFGETFPLYSGNAFGGRWITGIQAAVFAFFNIDADSMDLINADYWVGIPVAYRKDNLSGLFRIFHQSSHLGDEYLLYNKINRVNLSYESADLKLSYNIDNAFRIYAGTGYIIHKEPSGIDPFSAQFGVEYRSPWAFLSNSIRPIAALDLKTWEENDWDADASARLGVQLENIESKNRKVQLMLEYFSGHSPHGQFYNRTIEYAGLGIHFYF
jgi:hypothetical protein